MSPRQYLGIGLFGIILGIFGVIRNDYSLYYMSVIPLVLGSFVVIRASMLILQNRGEEIKKRQLPTID